MTFGSALARSVRVAVNQQRWLAGGEAGPQRDSCFPPRRRPQRLHCYGHLLRGGGFCGCDCGGVAQVFMSLETREELDAVRARAAVGLVIELEVLSGAQRKELLTHLVTKYNTAVQTELARQKEEMRLKAEAELARLREERQQRCACEAARARAAIGHLPAVPSFALLA